MLHTVEFLLDADNLLHNLNALVEFITFGQDVALGVELVQFLSED